MNGGGQKWDDLTTRVLTAVALLVVLGGGLWIGGTVLLVLVAIACGLMFWEFARMIGPDRPQLAIGIGLIGALLIPLYYMLGSMVFVIAFGALIGVGVVSFPNNRLAFGAYGAVILLGCLSVFFTRSFDGEYVFWLVAVVIASDVAGYLFGRLIGGPKFWPAVSPKKTWSGTIGGWICAALVGVAFAGSLGGNIIIASVFLAFAAQMGDIVESALKRRAGIKDSSNLLPGHGGLLDRFDGMIATFALWLFLAPLVLPMAIGN